MSAVPSWARVGAKVVCIKRDGWQKISGVDRGYRKPSFREECVVTEVDIWRGKALLRLAGYRTAWFAARHFRPVVTLDDDMAAHFEHHLHLSDFHPEPV